MSSIIAASFNGGLSKRNHRRGNLRTILSLLVLALLINGRAYSQVYNFNENATDLKSLKNEIQRKYKNEQSNHRDWLYTGLEVSYVSLNIADLITSYYSLAIGAKEANPIANLYIKNKPLSFIVKGSVTVGVLYSLRQVKKENKKIAYLTLGALNTLYAFVVNNNVGVYLELKK